MGKKRVPGREEIVVGNQNQDSGVRGWGSKFRVFDLVSDGSAETCPSLEWGWWKKLQLKFRIQAFRSVYRVHRPILVAESPPLLG